MSSKKIILMRHAQALDTFEAGVPRDSMRPLSAFGIAQAQDSAARLKTLLGKADKIICSPRLRALQTAEIAAAAFGRKPVIAECLGKSALRTAEFEEAILQELQGVDTLIAIGHNPSVSEVAARLGAPAVLGTAEFVIIEK